jgi:hypothetical protein
LGHRQLRANGSRQCANSTRSSSRPSEARAGIHNHRRFDLIELERPSRLTMNAGGYGSLLSQGRRGRIHFQEPTSNARSRSRGAMRPSRSFISRPLEGVGNAGRPLHPQPRVQCVGSTRVSSPRSHRDHPAFPHAMVLTASFVLSPVTGLVCHRHLRILAVSIRSDRHASANLTPASGRQDHTTSPSANNISRQRAL